MCAPDPNAGRRQAARVENNRRIAEFKANSIKQWNKESSFKDNIKTIRGLGRSRDYADFQEFSNQAQGKALLGKENLARQYFQSKSVDDGNRSRRFGGNIVGGPNCGSIPSDCLLALSISCVLLCILVSAFASPTVANLNIC